MPFNLKLTLEEAEELLKFILSSREFNPLLLEVEIKLEQLIKDNASSF